MATVTTKTAVKICLVSSSGGHLEQLLKLLSLVDKYSGYIVTEDVGYDLDLGEMMFIEFRRSTEPTKISLERSSPLALRRGKSYVKRSLT